jgi:hypothetical protein
MSASVACYFDCGRWSRDNRRLVSGHGFAFRACRPRTTNASTTGGPDLGRKHRFERFPVTLSQADLDRIFALRECDARAAGLPRFFFVKHFSVNQIHDVPGVKAKSDLFHRKLLLWS